MPTSFLVITGWHDVFHEILNHLKPPEDDDDDDDGDDDDDDIYSTALHTFRHTLVSLALSCRAFLNPSLDNLKLWRELDDIHPLLKLLPNFQYRESKYHLTGPISPVAWSRVKAYASRVRSIYLYSKLGSEIWSTILEQCQGTPLFPNLRALHMTMWPATYDGPGLIRCLVPPSLRDLLVFIEQVQGQDTPTVAALSGAILQEVSRTSPGLVDLFFFPRTPIASEYLLCLSRFTSVERLTLSDDTTLNESVLCRLASLERLKELKASILFRSSATASQLNHGIGLGNLTTLDLRGQPAHLARFILALAFPMSRLNNLRLELRDHFADEFLTSIPSICQHLGPHTLTSFRVALGDFVRPPRFLVHLLEPLFFFVNLRKLELFFEKHLPLRDADLERLARAWPQLEDLILLQSQRTLSHPDRVPGSVERPTLQGLVELARGCPHLSQICIPDLDTTSIPEEGNVPLLERGARNLCIQNLVGAQDNEARLGVAVVLDRLFPHLKLGLSGIEWMPGYGESENPHLEDSQSVTLLLRAMQIARRRCLGGV